MTKKFSIPTLLIGGRAVATTSASTQSHVIKLSNRKLRRNAASTQSLLQKARPYKQQPTLHSRHLDQNFQPDGSYNIQFSQCVDMKLFDGDLFGEDVIAYSQSGQLVSTKSYVLFHVCQEEDCYYESEDDLYLVDLPTYLASVGLYHVNARNDYCEACAEFEEYCLGQQQGDDDAAYVYGDDAAAAADDGGNAYGYNDDYANNGGRRNLNLSSQSARRTRSNLVDCDQCTTYNCYSQTDDFATQQQLDNDVSDWIAQLAACQNTGRQWNDMDLYVGAMCSPYGDGVELAVFVDQDCTAYTNQFTYKDVMDVYNDNGDDLASLAASYIDSAFTETIPCRALEFDDPNDAGNYNYDYDDDDANAQEVGLNDYCQQMLNGDAVDYSNCNKNYNNNGNNNQDDEYSWYSYDMTYEQANDLDTVCSTVKTLDGEFSYSYDEENSGTWYTRDRKSSSSSHVSGGANMAWVSALVILCLAAVVGAAVVAFRHKRKMERRRTPLYAGGALI
mmetsp:Transcript_12669/g.27538  ORF Transcript_12669/g.27538 Transcript_12669/m.27538 type:complete len:503 (+) Transcript_12669:218-1726(+)